MYKDNLKGFRKRRVIEKITTLMLDIEEVIDWVFKEQQEDYSMEGAVEHALYLKDRIEELEEQYSIIWRVKIQLQKGIKTYKTDLEYVNDVHQQIEFGRY